MGLHVMTVTAVQAGGTSHLAPVAQLPAPPAVRHGHVRQPSQSYPESRHDGAAQLGVGGVGLLHGVRYVAARIGAHSILSGGLQRPIMMMPLRLACKRATPAYLGLCLGASFPLGSTWEYNRPVSMSSSIA